MAQYKVTKVSQQEPRKWDNPKGGTIYYIKCMLEGHDRPVSIGKKAPDAIKVGDVVYGTITEDPNHDEDKFKADPPAFGGAGKSNFQPKDEEAIARAVSLKAAVDIMPSLGKETLESNQDYVLSVAEKFLAWLKERPEAPKSDEPRHEPVDEGF